MNLAALMSTSAMHHGDRTAIRQENVALSYAGLERATALVAGLLTSRGVEPGDRVGVMLPNVAYFPICYYGALRAGAAIVPMNMLLKEREVAYYMADSGARVLFAWHSSPRPPGPGRRTPRSSWSPQRRSTPCSPDANRQAWWSGIRTTRR